MNAHTANRYAIPAEKSAFANDVKPTQHQESTGRISVVRESTLVPLLASAQDGHPGDQPWKGVLLERHLVQPSEIPEHEHPHLCLHLQLRGDEKFEWWSSGKNAVEHTWPGSLILIPPGTTDRLRWQGPSERTIVSIDRNALADLARDWSSPRAPEFKGSWSLHDPSLRQLLMEMSNEARNGWPLGSLYADLLAMGLETRLLRSHATEPLNRPVLKGGLSLPRLRRAMEYINSNLAEDVRIEAIARELDLSSYHFAHEFRNSTGQTPYQYLIDQRMAKAKDLLKRTKWTVQYIGGLAGFRSPANFIRTFRHRLGQTPEVWRKNL